MFFTGAEAFEEVAKEDGAWNWALVGPDENELPLCGGGPGSVDEMRSAMGNAPFSFGLLRMNFGTGPYSKAKFVYVEASTMDDNTGAQFTQRERGQAAAKGPLMKKAIEKFTHAAITLQLTRTEDCNLENVFDKIKKSSNADADIVTLETYNAAMAEFKDFHTELDAEEKMEEQAEKAVEEDAPKAQAAEEEVETEAKKPAEPEVQPGTATAAEAEEPTRQRKMFKLFKTGDKVMIFSEKKMWHDDGTVADVMAEAGESDGFTLPANAMKVEYDHGRLYKWVLPHQTTDLLRPSLRPSQPPVLIGELGKETHNFFTTWNTRYFELSKGFLQWWEKVDDAKKGTSPNGLVSLLGLRMRLRENVFNIKSASTKGTIYSFKAATSEEAEKWTLALQQHCTYAEDMGKYVAMMHAQINQARKSMVATEPLNL